MAAADASGSIGTLYVNGAPVATNGQMTLNPSSLGDTTYNWIGKSVFSDDPYLSGSVDEFHIYDRALTAMEVQELADGAEGAGNVAAYRFDETSGSTAHDSSGNGRHGTLVTEW
jgi:acyl-homoserine lactone acylase PvdQ